MRILAIETSCDETSAAVIEGNLGDSKVKVLSNVVASSLKLHAKTGGVIPEVAARQQIKYIIPVIEKAMSNVILSKSEGSRDSLVASLPQNDIVKNIDAIAVTVGPGLIGSLLIGVETAKTLAFAWNKPIIPVNHLLAHIYANFIRENPKSEIRNSKLDARRYDLPARNASQRDADGDANIKFPFIALIVSGGHTDLLLFKSHKNYEWLGGTRDDAAGEALDKIARILGLSYPGGPIIEQRALKGNPKAFNFPRPMSDSENFDFSFSGLKAAVLREVQKCKQISINSHPELVSGSSKMLNSPRGISTTRALPSSKGRPPSLAARVQHDKKLNDNMIDNICASVQQAIVDVLVKKTVRAAKVFNVSTIVLGGGVSANQALREGMKKNSQFSILNSQLFVPPAQYATDNAAMIAAEAFFQYKEVPWNKITANPELYFD